MWKYVVAAISSMLVAGCSAAYDTHPERGESPLETALGTKRLLIICTGDDTGQTGIPLYGAQLEQAKSDWAGYLDRDLIVVWLRDKVLTSWSPFLIEGGRVDVRQRAESEDVAGLRKRVDCKPSKRGVHLIGKDTGLNRTWSAAVSNVELFSAIDAMPMRQREMRSE
ncbi:MAG: DUF4174 domain-containing protein [Pseudomonadota bacterium]